jgi:hypothetical protein
MAIKTMDDLFIHGLQDIYYAENQFAKTLPEMMEKASDPMLVEGSGRTWRRRGSRSSVWTRSSKRWAEPAGA